MNEKGDSGTWKGHAEGGSQSASLGSVSFEMPAAEVVVGRHSSRAWLMVYSHTLCKFIS